MRELFTKHRYFIIPYLIVIFIAFILKLNFSKEELFLFANSNHSALGDLLFPQLTHIGDGITFAVIILIFLFVRFRYAILGLIIFIVSSQITQFLKRVVFSDVPRPKRYFEGLQELHFVEGVKMYSNLSFPSGHTTSAFALAAFLALLTKNKWLQLLYLLIAIVAAYSRMYLGQHFFEDVFAGSMIGVLSAFACTYILQKTKWFQHYKLDKAIGKSKSVK